MDLGEELEVGPGKKEGGGKLLKDGLDLVSGIVVMHKWAKAVARKRRK